MWVPRATEMASGTGRVGDLRRGGPVAPFQVFAEAGSSSSSRDASAFASGSLEHTWTARDVAPATTLFMSRTNVEALQQGIRYRVYVDSRGRHVIGRQSDAELAIIMRSILLQDGRNATDTGAVQQVRALNALVIAFCVPRIISELVAYENSLDDVSRLPMPLDRGQIASSKGDRQLTFSLG